MKITTFLLFISVFQVLATGNYAQNTKLNLDLGKTTVAQVLQEIEHQSEFYFLFNQKLVDVDRQVNMDLKNKKIDDVLVQVFEGTDVEYMVIDRQIVISPKEYLADVKKFQQTEVTGTVTDAQTGDPLPGVNIIIKGTTQGTTTDMNGNYSIEVPSDATLVFTFVGYQEQNIEVNGRQEIDVAMQQTATQLEEVVAVGYGTKKKVNLTGSVSVVGEEEFEERPISNVQEGLQGAIPNLTLAPTTAGGEPGSGMSMNIRGLQSFEGNTDPYVLVDGVPMNINDIDPNDIESISVLKDAAASAIYGARAAHGVILITTKGGKEGTQVRYSTNIARSTPTIWPERANTMDFILTMNESAVNSGRAPYYDEDALDRLRQNLEEPGSAPPMLPSPDGQTWDIMNTGMKAVANEDWDALIINKWAPQVKHNLSVAGGSEKMSYYVSAGYFDEEGLLKIGNESFQRYNINTKIEAQATSWLNLSFNAKYRQRQEDFPWNQFFGRSWIMNWISKIKPGLPAKYPGTDVWTLESRVGEWQRMREVYDRKQLVASPKIAIEPIDGWVTNFELNYKHNSDDYNTTAPQIPWVRPNGEMAYRPSSRSQTVYESDLYTNEYLSPNVYSNYTKSFGSHNLNVMAGYEQEVYKYNNMLAHSMHLLSDNVTSISTTVGELNLDDNVGHWATRSFFGRINYDFDEKYLLELNIRRDGSSRFDEDERWGTFPSASVGWAVSKENFFPLKDQVDLFKLRASYGSLGNQDVNNYLYIPTMPISQTDYWLFSGEREWTVGAPNLTSVNLTWEKVNTIDFGVDAALLNNRLGLNFDWYESTTTDLVGPGVELPSVLGTQVPKSNAGEIRTRGWELEISWKNKVGDFSYGFRGVLSDYTSEVIHYNNPNKLLNTYYDGMELGEIWGLETEGLFQSEEEIANWHDQSYIYSGTWYPGDVKYVDQTGDGKVDIGENTYDDHGDKKVLGNSTPRYQFGLNANASWKGFDVSVLFQGVGKRDVNMGSFGTFRGPANGPMHASCYEEHMDYWRDEDSPLGANRDAYFPRPYSQFFGQNAKNFRFATDRYLQDASFLRLKNFQLGYTLPSSITERVFISNARIYVSGENVLTFTNMKIYDPEAFRGRYYGSGDAYPLSKSYSVGLTVNF